MLKNQLPTGVRDELGINARIKETTVNTIQNYFYQRGFEKIKTPVIEYQDVFEDYDVGQQRLFKFLSASGNSVVLRPDMTLPLARVLSSTQVKLPAKFYYSGDIFRINKALSGSQDEMTQAGAELIGFSSMKAEQECLSMMIELAKILELDSIQIELGLARFVKQILEMLTDNIDQIHAIEEALFSKQITKYNQLIAAFDESEYTSLLKIWPRLFGPAQDVLDEIFPYKFPERLQEKVTELRQLVSWLQVRYPNQNVEIDLSTRAPQDYYTGITFQAYSSQSATFLFSGGRYDHLLNHFQKEKVAAIGLGIDVDQIALISQADCQTTPMTYIYFNDNQWELAEQKLMELDKATLCLVDSLEEAQKVADNNDGQLLDLTAEVIK